jgi:hypothetical protein
MNQFIVETSPGEAQDDLTRRYEELCVHYGMTPSRNNPGVAHEIGMTPTDRASDLNLTGRVVHLRGKDTAICSCLATTASRPARSLVI